MDAFLVICVTREKWFAKQKSTKIVDTSKFFGLLRSARVEFQPEVIIPGPVYKDQCIVTDVINTPDGTYYRLIGYPHWVYDSIGFMRIDRFPERQEEIEEESEPIKWQPSEAIFLSNKV